MKKYLFSTFICSLLALVGCQQNDELIDLPTNNGEKVTVTANIQGSGNTRVTLTDQGTSGIKVDWNASGEKFNVYGKTGDVQEFTQTSGNQFSGTLPETTGDYYMASYNCTYTYDVDSEELELSYDLSQQDGTLNKSYVMMSCEAEDTDPLTFNFKHHTFILKPTFKVGEETLANNTITKIVMGALEAPKANDWDVETITITREASAGDIYIFVPQTKKPLSNYYTNKKIPFEVTAGGKEYTAEFTITNTSEIGLLAGYLYTAEVELTEKIPYVTFSAAGTQQLYMTSYKTGLQYSLNGGDWTTLNAPVNFGGTLGDLRLKGTLTNGTGGSNIRFAYANVPVACTGDIRTLIAGDNYTTIPGGQKIFTSLFKNCTQLTSAPKLPLTGVSIRGYKEMFYNCTSLTTAPELPATTLSESCYESMFVNCTSLTTAPVLPATKLVRYCYRQMFNGCSSLNSITMLATDISESRCLDSWVTGVAETGTFTKAASMTSLAEGTNGIPSGWTVVSQ